MELFTDNWMNPPVLYEGERLYRIVNHSNPCDNLLVVRPADMHGTEFDDAVRWALFLKYGKRAAHMCYELEDVTELYYCDTTED